MSTKLISWNVNGVRAAIKKGLLDYLDAEQPDVFCIQETKAMREQVDEGFEGWHVFWNAAERKGYSGTAILTREAPITATMGLGQPEHDTEGRVITLEFPAFHLVNVYTPNSGDGLRRLDYRHNEWDPLFLNHLLTLQETKPVIFCGDLNVAVEEIDLARPATNHKSAGFTDEEREGFRNILSAGFRDSFRDRHPDEPEHYSWWSYRGGARSRNVGWRIDYFGISPALDAQVKSAFIRPDVLGSDHCPVGLELA